MDDNPMTQNNSASLVELSADIAAAYLSSNTLAAAAVPDLIKAIYDGLALAASGTAEPPAGKLQPAVSIKKSVTPEFLISLEDGHKYKSLKRHLRTKYGMSPDDYRAKWGLAKDYPMVAPNYAASRSALAKKMGLGRKAAPVKAPPRGRAKAKA
jgi:predicted transcriptional regulator